MLHTAFTMCSRLALLAAMSLSLTACSADPLPVVTGHPLHTGTTPMPRLALSSTSSLAPARPEPASHLQVPAGAPASFEQWRERFRREALATGILPQVFDRAFAGVTPDPGVIRADRSQPEFSRPVWDYLDGALSTARISGGQKLLARHAALLQQLENRYGVSRYTLVAIWGLESSFGQVTGNRPVIRSLATLAYEGRRPDFARSQLLAALQILQQGDIRPEYMQGSWAGAMGQTQFIPSTYQEYAVDFDGDGRRDIWNSTADALASTARYLQASGWQGRQPWGFEVQLPRQFDYALADPELQLPVARWRQLGVQGIPAGHDSELASLLLLAGYRGPAFLTLNNFRSVLHYNNSSSYALAISLLAERFQGRGTLQARWPRQDVPLSRSERIELQQQLASLGFNPGSADGIIGANTRQAIRAYQKANGWPADGYPTQQLLGRLRQAPAGLSP